jgi:hypothetical protein
MPGITDIKTFFQHMLQNISVFPKILTKVMPNSGINYTKTISLH